MKKREGYLDFISSENYKNQVEIWYKAYNINREKIDLFRDFIFTLYDLVEETYLGEDVMVEDKDQEGHFAWCWDKTISNFEKENISFKERGSHYNYFWSFFQEAFYINKLENNDDKIKEYHIKLFSFNYRKSRAELDVLTETYKLLESNLKK